MAAPAKLAGCRQSTGLTSADFDALERRADALRIKADAQGQEYADPHEPYAQAAKEWIKKLGGIKSSILEALTPAPEEAPPPANETPKERADRLFQEIRDTRDQQKALLQKNGRMPREGTEKRAQHDALQEKGARLMDKWIVADDEVKRNTERKETQEPTRAEQKAESMADLEKALEEYNSVPPENGVYAKEQHEKKVKAAANYIRETAADQDEPYVVRARAQLMLDEHIDPKDLASVNRRQFMMGAAAAAAGVNAGATDKVGNAKPVSTQVMQSKMSSKAQAILRGNANGKAQAEGTAQITAALREIAANGPPELRKLAQVMVELMPARGISLTVNDTLENAPVHGSMSLKGTPHLKLYAAGSMQGMTHETFLHEVLHGIIVARYHALNIGAIRGNDAILGVPTPKAAAQIQQLVDVWKEFQQEYEKAVGDMSLSRGSDAEFSARQAAGKIDEFFVRALTDPYLQGWMATREYKGTTLWNRFKDWVKNLLGVKASWLDAALTATTELTTAAKEDVGDFSRFTKLEHLRNTDGELKSQLNSDNKEHDLFAAPDTKRQPTLSSWYQAATSGLHRNAPGSLGWLTNRQLGDTFGKATKAITDTINVMSAKAKMLIADSHNVDISWAKLKDPEILDLNRAMLRSTIAKTFVLDPVDGKILDQGSTRFKELNGHISQTALADYPSLRALFNSMSQAQRDVYLQAQRKLKSDWDEYARLYRQNVLRQYRPVLEPLFENKADKMQAIYGVKTLEDLANLSESKRNNGNLTKTLSAEVRRAVRELWNDVDQHAEMLKKMQGPYFPLSRFGEHAVVRKSNAYKAIEAQIDQASKNLQVLLETEPETVEESDTLTKQIKDARKLVSELTERREKMRGDQEQYAVEFFESRVDAIARHQQLQDWINANETRKASMEVYHQRRTDYEAALDKVNSRFLSNLEDRLTASLPKTEHAEVRNVVRALYLQNLPDRAALKNMLQRQNVAGVKAAEMRRGFAATTMRNAWRLSRLEYGADLQDMVESARRSNDEDTKIAGGELAKRLYSTMKFDDGGVWPERAANLGYLYHLALSPAFLFTNLTQPYVISVPVMAGRFGLGRAANEQAKASAQVSKVMAASLTQQGFRFTVDLNGKDFTKEESKMLKTLFNQGLIDVTIEHDMGAVASGKDTTAFGAAVRLSAWPAHQSETLNRISTALAAFRLARQNPSGGLDGAIAYAEKVLADTHLDYTAENAPRLMRAQALGGLGRLLFQFKKYQQGMIYLLVRNAQQMLRGDKEAGKAFGYLLGMQLATAGMTGLPLVGNLASIGLWAFSKAFGDDDDDPEVKQVFYKGMKDAVGETAAQALMKGLPAAAGVDVSNLTGMGDVFNPIAFAKNQGKKGGDWMTATILSLFGPTPALAVQFADAAQYWQEGDMMKFWQTAMPRVIQAGLKGYDIQDRGITDRRGNVLMSPEELDGWGVPRAFGFSPTKVSDMYDARNAFQEAKTDRDAARTLLIRQYLQAQDKGAVREKIDAYNERHPEQSLRIKPVDIINAEREARKRVQETSGGVRIAPRDRGLAERLGVTQ